MEETFVSKFTTMDWGKFREQIADLFNQVIEWSQFTLFKMGEVEISFGTIIYILIAFFILSFVSKKFKIFLIGRVFKRAGMDPGTSAPIANLLRIVFLTVGMLVIIQSAGINLSALTVLFGALGVGIGFGLQNITNNFISGIVILFEKPIKVGDRIELDNVNGKVTNISIRATTVVTNDNIAIIVPNSEFISGRVINWSHNDRIIRFRIPVGVSYNEDPEKIKRILLEVAAENTEVLENPAPDVLFDEFGDSSLNFKMAVWTATSIDRMSPFKSDIYYAVFEKFKEHNIEIPFPQRDLHLRSSSISFK